MKLRRRIARKKDNNFRSLVLEPKRKLGSYRVKGTNFENRKARLSVESKSNMKREK